MLRSVSLALTLLATACSREMSRLPPSISNSIVNLGKMEIAFHINSHDIPQQSLRESSPFFLPKSDVLMDEPCPCSSLRNIKDSFLGNPSGILNKLLMNNDLFSSKDPVTSTLCCDSHEHIEEGSVIFELPKQKPKPALRGPMPFLPFIFDSPNNPNLPLTKTKAIEIFLFPKKKETGNIELPKMELKKKDVKIKDDITIVGGKDLKKSFTDIPLPPIKEEQKELKDLENKPNTL